MSSKKSIEISIKSLPKENRPRERLLNNGPAHLSDSELLAVLFGKGSGKTSVLKLAHSLMSSHKDLSNLSEISIQDLMGFKGLGLAKAAQLISAFELSKRMNTISKQTTLSSPVEVVNYIRPLIYHSKKESFYVLSLDSRNNCISFDIISQGTVNSTLVHPREVFSAAISRHAVHIILVHNHPSNNCEPSEDDKQVTRKLAQSGTLLDIPVEDHIIVSASGYFSFKESQLM
ncbi:MAG: DNA repair protein RadC [Patescibacteria group bacterium]